MLIKNPKNKFSLLKNSPSINKANIRNLDIKNNVLINVSDNPSKYTISIYLRGLRKNSITLSYINNFLVIDFTFKGAKYSSLKYKRTIYLKDIDISKIQHICSSDLIYITLPKKLE